MSAWRIRPAGRFRLWPVFMVAMLALPVIAPAAVYTWTDDQGVTHYSDRPGGRHATPMDRSVMPLAPESDSAPDEDSEAADEGRRARIVMPAADAVIDNADARVVVAVRLSGSAALGPDESLIYRLDGRELSDAPPQATRLAIQPIGPGPHQLSVTLAVAGQPTGRSDSVRFSVAADSSANAGQATSGRSLQ